MLSWHCVNRIITALKQRVEEGEWFYYEVRDIPFGSSLPDMKSYHYYKPFIIESCTSESWEGPYACVIKMWKQLDL